MTTKISLETWVQHDCTIGRLTFDGLQLFTLELPWRGNQPNISCVPEGTYRVTKYQSPTKGPVLLLHDVPGRTYIEIHAGNFIRQIEGCVLVGDGLKHLDVDGVPDVTNSRAALDRLLAAVPDETTIEIVRSYSRP